MKKSVEMKRLEEVLSNFGVDLEEFECFANLAESPEQDVKLIDKACQLFKCNVSSFSKKGRKVFDDIYNEYKYFSMHERFCMEEDVEIIMATNPTDTLAKIFGNKQQAKEENEKNIAYLKNYLTFLSNFDERVYHKNATLKILKEKEYALFEFEQIFPLCDEFCKLNNDYEELFFKILKGDLKDDLVQKFNLLSVVLDARDLISPKQTITYEYVQTNREVFKKEGFQHLEEYVSIRRLPEVFKCKNFYRDETKAKAFISKFPLLYAKMKEFLPSVLYREVKFAWTDDKIMLEEENQADFNNVDFNDDNLDDYCDKMKHKQENSSSFLGAFYHETFECVGEKVIDEKKFYKIQKVSCVLIPVQTQSPEIGTMKKLCANSKISGLPIKEDNCDIFKRLQERCSLGWRC